MITCWNFELSGLVGTSRAIALQILRRGSLIEPMVCGSILIKAKMLLQHLL
jgi:hypothetical protein